MIGGEARGRKIVAPNVVSVRPTSDRVREAMFDVLAHLVDLEGANVLDLFAGSGALGIEALSRGATSATFVDSDRDVIKTINDNLKAAKLNRVYTARVNLVDAIAFCRVHRSRLDNGGDVTTDVEHFDVTFCDPPYSFTNWQKLLADLPGDLVILESSKPIDLPSQFDLHRVYKYGSTLVTVARQQGFTKDSGALAPESQVHS